MVELIGDVAVAGDWHGQRRYMEYAVRWCSDRGIDFIFHVGDIGFFEMDDLTFLEPLLAKLDIPLYWIDGNHENHELIATLPRDEYGFGFVSEHIRHIPRGHTFMVNEQVWMGFGGAISLDVGNRREGIDWWPGERISLSELESVRGKRADVLLTHDAPMGVGALDDRYTETNKLWKPELVVESDQLRMMLRDIMDEVRPSVLFHGHHHFHHVSTLGDATVIGLDMNDTSLTRNIAQWNMFGDIKVGGEWLDLDQTSSDIR